MVIALRVVLGLLMLLVVNSQLAAQQYRFTTIDFPDAGDTLVTGINDSGVLIGQYGEIDPSDLTAAGNHGFLFSGDLFEDIRFPDADSTAPSGINSSGAVVGNYVDSNGKMLGFVFDGNYRQVVTPFAPESVVNAINTNGTMVGIYSDDEFTNDVHGFFFDGQTFETFDAPGATQTLLTTINDLGQFGGSFNTPVSSNGFLGPEFRELAIPSPFVLQTSVAGLSNANQVVGTFLEIAEIGPDGARLRFNGFAYDPSTETFTGIDLPGPNCSFLGGQEIPGQCVRRITGVNAAGTIVGYYNDGNFHGFIGHLASDDGDLDGSGIVDAADIDLLSAAVRNGTADSRLDLNGDGLVDQADRHFWVQDLAQTWFGDADLDREVGFGDFLLLSQNFSNPGGWGEGDFNGDGVSQFEDFLLLSENFGNKAMVASAVPEPSGACLALVLLAFCFRHRHAVWSEHHASLASATG